MIKEFIPTDDDVLQAVKITTNAVRKIAQSGADSFCPMLNLSVLNVDKREMESRILAIPDLPDTSEERSSLMRTIGAGVVDEGLAPMMAVLTTEGWMLRAEKGAPPDDLKGVRPSESPDRVEVVIVSACTATGRCANTIYEIRRRESEIPVVLVPINDFPVEVSQYEKGSPNLIANLFVGAMDQIALLKGCHHEND